MTTLIDDLNRADAGTLGSAYSVDPGNQGGSDLRIVGNQAAGNWTPATVYKNDVIYGPDCMVSIDCPVLPVEDFRVMARVQNPDTAGADCYMAVANVSAGTMNLIRIDDSAVTYLNTTSGITWVAGDILKMGVFGTGSTVTICVFRNGSLINIYKDTAAARITAAGYLGFGNYDSAYPVGRLDNFRGDTLVPFPFTPVISDFTVTESPLSAPWSSKVQSANAQLEASGGACFAMPGGSFGSGSMIIPTVVSLPMEMFFTKISDNAAYLYGFWAIQPGTENGAGILDAYSLLVPPAGTSAQVLRHVNDVETALATISPVVSTTGDQWGIRFEANGDISVYQNGAQVGLVNDTTYTSGYLGILASGWGFDNYGGGAMTTPQKFRPDADIVTTGWATAPLWSKVDEASAGGDVITATAS